MLPLNRPPQIRSFDSADLDAGLRLFGDTVRTVNRRDYSAEQVAAWAPEVPDREAWLARLAAPWTLVAEEASGDKRTIVGFGQLRPDGRVDLLYVHAQRQREGIGSLLLERMLKLAQAAEMQSLTVEASITARPFFARHGFETVAQQQVERRGVTLVNYLMGRKA